MPQPQRQRPSIGEHLDTAREQARQMDELPLKASTERLSRLLCCLENLTEALQKLYHQNQELQRRVEDLEDAAQ